ncbi:MAG: hypothetical protein ACXWLR_14130 [Myxococcales bacterium]
MNRKRIFLAFAASLALVPHAFASGGSGSGGSTPGINSLPTTAPAAAGGQIWMLLSQVAPFNGTSGSYEVRVGAEVVTSGPVVLEGFTPVSLVVDPAAQTVSATVNGTDLGTFAARVAPSYLALEGQGWADDVIVRSVP